MILEDEQIESIIRKSFPVFELNEEDDRKAVINALLKAQLKKDLEASSKTRTALQRLLHHYLSVVNSGDAGFWNPEEEDEVIMVRQALLEEVKE